MRKASGVLDLTAIFFFFEINFSNSIIADILRFMFLIFFPFCTVISDVSDDAKLV